MSENVLQTGRKSAEKIGSSEVNYTYRIRKGGLQCSTYVLYKILGQSKLSQWHEVISAPKSHMHFCVTTGAAYLNLIIIRSAATRRVICIPAFPPSFSRSHLVLTAFGIPGYSPFVKPYGRKLSIPQNVIFRPDGRAKRNRPRIAARANIFPFFFSLFFFTLTVTFSLSAVHMYVKLINLAWKNQACKSHKKVFYVQSRLTGAYVIHIFKKPANVQRVTRYLSSTGLIKEVSDRCNVL